MENQQNENAAYQTFIKDLNDILMGYNIAKLN